MAKRSITYLVYEQTRCGLMPVKLMEAVSRRAAEWMTANSADRPTESFTAIPVKRAPTTDSENICHDGKRQLSLPFLNRY